MVAIIWGSLGAFLARFGAILEPLEPSGGLLGAFWTLSEISGAHLGAILSRNVGDI